MRRPLPQPRRRNVRGRDGALGNPILRLDDGRVVGGPRELGAPRSRRHGRGQDDDLEEPRERDVSRGGRRPRARRAGIRRGPRGRRRGRGRARRPLRRRVSRHGLREGRVFPAVRGPDAGGLCRPAGEADSSRMRTDASTSARSTPASQHGRPRPLGAVFFDYDGDGQPDLYVANDRTTNVLYRNKRRWHLRGRDGGGGAGARDRRTRAPGWGSRSATSTATAGRTFSSRTSPASRRRSIGTSTARSSTTRPRRPGSSAPRFPYVQWGTDSSDLDDDGPPGPRGGVRPPRSAHSPHVVREVFRQERPGHLRPRRPHLQAAAARLAQRRARAPRGRDARIGRLGRPASVGPRARGGRRGRRRAARRRDRRRSRAGSAS